MAARLSGAVVEVDRIDNDATQILLLCVIDLVTTLAHGETFFVYLTLTFNSILCRSS